MFTNLTISDKAIRIISVALGTILGVVLLSVAVNAASTISTNISTGGTLSVTGVSTLTGRADMIQASSTRFSVHDTAYFGGSATSTFNSAGLGTFQGYVSQASSTVVGAFTVTGHSALTTASSTITSQTGNFLVNGYATTTALNGNIETAGTLTVTGASTLTGDATFSGGNGAITVTTTNAATSTISVGCLQMHATSTATAVHITFATAQIATTTSQGGTGDTTGTYGGVVVWRYGACPI